MRWQAVNRVPAAFSLIELLAVMAILIILTTLYWGSSSGSKERALVTSCQNNLKQIYMALELYAHDDAGKYPVVPGAKSSEQVMSLLVPQYTIDPSPFICPATSDPSLSPDKPLSAQTISYACYMGRKQGEGGVLLSDRQVDSLAKAAGEYAFSKNGKGPGSNHKQLGGNFLFTDGHAEQTPPKLPFSLMLNGGVQLLNPKPSP